MTEGALPTGVVSGKGADRPPEERGAGRDDVRLLVSTPEGETTRRFIDLAEFLRPGDLLVVNESATVPASLPARSKVGEFIVNLSTPYGRELWVAEPRWRPDRPGPLPLDVGASLEVGGVHCTVVAPFPGIPRLVFLHADGDLVAAMRTVGEPIRYGYAARRFPLDAYQTEFARVPGSAEMPSAGRPFTPPLLENLRSKGVDIAPIVLHTGVSSLELDDVDPRMAPVFPEPFEVPGPTAEAIRYTRSNQGRVVAVGTTVVRALESAADSCRQIRGAKGFTRVYLGPDRPVRTVDALLTGFHDARSSHLSLLSAFVGVERIRRAYEFAARDGFLWHEFGDSHLILSASAA